VAFVVVAGLLALAADLFVEDVPEFEGFVEVAAGAGDACLAGAGSSSSVLSAGGFAAGCDEVESVGCAVVVPLGVEAGAGVTGAADAGADDVDEGAMLCVGVDTGAGLTELGFGACDDGKSLPRNCVQPA